MEVTIQISDETYRNYLRAAKQTKRRVEEVISEKIEGESFPDKKAIERELEVCSDEEVLKIFNAAMPKKQDSRHSKLLYLQQARELTEKERDELDSLMQIYRIITLRRAVAIGEALKRGLKLPIDLA